MSTHNICFYEELQKLSFHYHQLPTLSVPLCSENELIQVQFRIGAEFLMRGPDTLSNKYGKDAQHVYKGTEGFNSMLTWRLLHSQSVTSFIQ